MDRLAKLTQKVDSFQATSVKNRNFFPENRLRALETEMEDFGAKQARRYAELAEELRSVRAGFEESKLGFEAGVEGRLGKLAGAERKLEQFLEGESKAFKDANGRVSNHLVETFEAIEREMACETERRAANSEKIKQEFQTNLAKIVDDIKTFEATKAEVEARLGGVVSESCEGLIEELEEMRRERERKGDEGLSVIREVVERLKLELGKEKEEREETEKRVLKLLEDTCDKLDHIER